MESRGGSASHRLAPVPDPEPMRPPHGIFNLPFEIRLFIWEYAIVDGRMLQPRGEFDSLKKKWILLFPQTRQHSLTQVCSETRKFMLDNGDFIFGKDPTEPGLWWNANVDTLFFNHKWDPRFESNALEGLQGLDKVKNVIIDQDLARWMSFYAIYDPEEDSTNISPDNLEQPLGFRFCYPDNPPYFKFFLFNGIHPDNLTVLFTRLLQRLDAEPGYVEFEIDAFPDQRVPFNFLNDEVGEIERKLAQLQSLWRQSKRNQPDRYTANMDRLMMDSFYKPGPQFRKGASCEELGGYYEEDVGFVDPILLNYFSDMGEDWYIGDRRAR